MFVTAHVMMSDSVELKNLKKNEYVHDIAFEHSMFVEYLLSNGIGKVNFFILWIGPCKKI